MTYRVEIRDDISKYPKTNIIIEKIFHDKLSYVNNNI